VGPTLVSPVTAAAASSMVRLSAENPTTASLRSKIAVYVSVHKGFFESQGWSRTVHRELFQKCDTGGRR
jgi:hypothetical protein